MKKVPEMVLMMGLLSLTLPQARAQDFPWNDFERRTLQELVKSNVAEDADVFKRYPGKGQFVFRAKIMPSVVRVTHTGQSRGLSTERKKFIELWAGTYATTPKYGSFFESEFLFKEG
jgi:hypothetical protein